jgi:hypothetical protein
MKVCVSRIKIESVCWGQEPERKRMNFYEAAVLAILNFYAHVWPGVRHGDPGLHVRGKRPCIRQADWGSGYLLLAIDSRRDPTLNAGGWGPLTRATVDP